MVAVRAHFAGGVHMLVWLRLQICVQPSALAEDVDGEAAIVAVGGGNKIKLKKGVAVLRDLRLSASAPGIYILAISSASRKVCIFYPR